MATDEEQYYQDELNALRTQPPIVLPTRARSSPDDGTRPGWLGLLGLFGLLGLRRRERTDVRINPTTRTAP